MNPEAKAMTIGQLASATGVGVETIRFYERRKLIPEPPRRRSGYRQYPEEAGDRIRFIRRAKELGFSLKEISGLLSLRVETGTTCGDVKSCAEEKILDIEGRIRSLRRMQRALEQLASECTATGATRECPILEALERNSS